MAQISLVKTLVLSYMELQRQIDNHTSDEPSYILRNLRDQQAAILASLEAKEPVELNTARTHQGTVIAYGHGTPYKTEAEARVALEELFKSQKEPVDE